MKNVLSPLILSSSLIASPAALANHIDFLTDAGFSIDASADDSDPAGGPTIITGSNIGTGNAGNIIGSERDVFLIADFGSYNAQLDVPAGSGSVGSNTSVILNVSPTGTDASGSFGSLRLTYDGQGSAGLGGLDFASSWDSLDVNFDRISGGALDLRLAVTDTNGNTGRSALGALDMGGIYSFPFLDREFVNAGVDFTSLDSIVFDFETIDPGVSFGIASITREAVPEPSSSLLLGLSLIGLVTRRRR